MTRSAILSLAAAALLCTAGCNDAADEQEKASAAQAAADKKIAEAQAEAKAKMTGAQAEADKKIAEAQAGFMKLREDYRHTLTTQLADLDKKIADLEAKAKAANGKAKADLDARLDTIHAARERLTRSFNDLEKTTAASWDATKANLDKEWNDLKDIVDKS